MKNFKKFLATVLIAVMFLDSGAVLAEEVINDLQQETVDSDLPESGGGNTSTGEGGEIDDGQDEDSEDDENDDGDNDSSGEGDNEEADSEEVEDDGEEEEGELEEEELPLMAPVTKMAAAGAATVNSYQQLKEAVEAKSSPITFIFSPMNFEDTIVIDYVVEINGNGTPINSPLGKRHFEFTDSSRGSKLDNMILSGNDDGGGIWTAADLTLNRVSIQNCRNENGGAIFSRRSLTLNGCTIKYNYADFGGGIYGENTITLTGSKTEIEQNRAAKSGGGVYSSGNFISEEVAPDMNTISENTAGENGGGLYLNYTGSDVSRIQADINDNNAGGHGGGIYNATSITLDKGYHLSIGGNTAGSNGGGIYNYTDGSINGGTDDSRAYLELRKNSAESGGGIYNMGEIELPELEVFIQENEAVNYGAGIYNQGGLYLKGDYSFNTVTAIAGNKAKDGTNNLYGGGIYNDDAPDAWLMIDNVVIEGNKANNGGGIYTIANNRPLITNSNISSNEANETAYGNGYGGGIYMAVADAEITFSNIYANDAGFGGAIYIDYESQRDDQATLYMSGTFIYDNTASHGGGIYTGMLDSKDTGTLYLEGATIEGNAAQYGGGIYSSANLYLNLVGIDNNEATEDGGGVLLYEGTGQSGGPAILGTWGDEYSSSTISNNTAKNGAGVYALSGAYMAKYNFHAKIDTSSSAPLSIINNSATDSGGGIYGGMSLNIYGQDHNLVINGNSAPNQGGGIYTPYAVYVYDAEISYNNAEEGGGIYNMGNNVNSNKIITDNAIIRGNSANYGGGIYLFNRNQDGRGFTYSITNSDLIGNRAYTDGGAIYVSNKETLEALKVTKSRFEDNTAATGYFWRLDGTDSANAGLRSLHITNITEMTKDNFSFFYDNAYNNFDIYIPDGGGGSTDPSFDPVVPVYFYYNDINPFRDPLYKVIAVNKGYSIASGGENRANLIPENPASYTSSQGTIYVFNRDSYWYEENGASQRPPSNYANIDNTWTAFDMDTPIYDITYLYGSWEEGINVYFMRNYSNYDEVIHEHQIIPSGTTPNRPDTEPIRVNHSFNDWYTTHDASKGQLFDDNQILNGDMYYYANWIEEIQIKRIIDKHGNEKIVGDFVKTGDKIKYEISWFNHYTQPAEIKISDFYNNQDFIFLDVDSVTVTGEFLEPEDEHPRTYNSGNSEGNYKSWYFNAQPLGRGTLIFEVEIVKNSSGMKIEELLENQRFISNYANVSVKLGDTFDTPAETNKVYSPLEPYKEIVGIKEGEYVGEGDTLTYKIKFYNPSDSAITYSITDELEEGLTFKSANPDATNSVTNNGQTTLTWKGSIPSKALLEITVTAEVNEKASGSIKNHASYTLEIPNPEGPDTVTGDTNEIVNPLKHVKRVQTSGGVDINGVALARGQQIRYAIIFNNTEAGATIIIEDILDDNLRYDTCSLPSRMSLPVVENQKLTFTGTNMNVGQHTLYIYATVKADAVKTIKNVANVKINDKDTVPTNEVENPLKPLKTIIAPLDSNGKADSVAIGETITYEISYYNHTNAPALVIITDKLDDAVDYVSSDNGGNYDSGTHTVTWSIPVQQKTEGKVSLTVEVNDNAETAIKNSATVKIGNDYEEDSNEVTTSIRPSKSITFVNDQPYNGGAVNIGDILTYRITFYNNVGDNRAVTITDTLPDGLEYITADGVTVSQGTVGAVTSNGNILTIPLSGINRGKNYIEFKVKVLETIGDSIKNIGSVRVGTSAEEKTNEVVTPLKPKKSVDISSAVGYGNSPHVKVGDIITYRIDYFNHLDEEATVVITDAFKAEDGLKFETANKNYSYNTTDETVTITLTVPPETDGYVLIYASVTNKANGYVVKNKASVKIGSNPAEDTNEVENPLPPVKTIDTNNAAYKNGDIITYTIQYYNYKNQPANLVITDTLDSKLTDVEPLDNGQYSASNHTITWEINDVPEKSGGMVKFKATVAGTASGTIENTGELKVGNDVKVDSNTITTYIDDGEPIYPVKEYSENSAVKAGNTVQIGDVIKYKIKYFNHTPNAEKVLITDKLDPGLDYISTSPEGVYDESAHQLTWELDVPGKTGGEVEITVKVNVFAEEKVSNKATVKLGDVYEKDTENLFNDLEQNSFEPIKIVESINSLGTIITEHTAGHAVRDGDIITYRIAFFNYTTNMADIIVTDILQKGLVYDSAKIVPDSLIDTEITTGLAADDGTLVTAAIKNVPKQSGGYVYITVKVTDEIEGAIIKNTAKVKVGSDNLKETPEISNPYEKSEKPQKSVDSASAAGFGGADVEVGDYITYKISYYNHLSKISKVTITDTLDSGLRFENVKDENGNDVGYSVLGRKYTFTIPEAAASSRGAIYVTAQVLSGALTAEKVKNKAEVQVEGEDSDETNEVVNPVKDPKDPKQPEKSIHSSTQGSEYIKTGDEVVFKITYYNHLENTATIIIKDYLPEELEFISAAADPHVIADIKEENNTVTITINNVLPGQSGYSGYVLITTKVKAEAMDKAVIVNKGGVIVGTENEVPTDEVPLYPGEAINPVKSIDETSDGKAGAVLKAGDEITYRITYYNHMNTATEVVIKDTLSKGLTFVSSDPVHESEVNNTVTIRIPDVPSETGDYVLIKAVVNEDAYDETEVENTAAVKIGHSPEVSTNPVVNEVEKPTAEVKPEKTVDSSSHAGQNGASVKEGDIITYRIKYFNNTDSRADVVITEKMGTGLKYLNAVGGGLYPTIQKNESDLSNVIITIENVESKTGGYILVKGEVTDEAVDEVTNNATVNPGDKDYDVIVKNTVGEPKKPEKTVWENSKAGKGGADVKPGDIITYEIKYYNHEPVKANVVITDKLDAGLTYLSSSPEGTYEESSRTATIQIDDAEPLIWGVVRITAMVNEDALINGKVNNQAEVKIGNNPSAETDIVTNDVKEPGTETLPEKDVDDTSEAGKNGDYVKPGDILTYRITYYNHTSNDAVVTIQDILGDGLEYVSGSAKGFPYAVSASDVAYDPIENIVTIPVKEVPGKRGGFITIQAKVMEDALIEGIVENDGKVDIGGNGYKQVVEPTENKVVEPKAPEKSVDESSHGGKNGSSVKPGDEITYRITYTNHFDEDADIIITDTIDTGADLLSVEFKGSVLSATDYDYNSTTRKLTVELKDQSKGEGFILVTVKVNNTAVDKITNQASVSIGGESAVNTNKVDISVDDNEENPVKEIDRNSSAGLNSGIVLKDDLVTYRISFYNHHDTEADIIITDTLAKGLAYESYTVFGGNGSPEFNQSGQRLTITVKGMEAKTKGYILLTVKVMEEAYEYDEISNTATVKIGDDAEKETVPVKVYPKEPETPVKTVDSSSHAGKNGASVKVGDEITYRISYFNYETEPANVTITDILGKGLEYVSSEPAHS